MKIVCFDLDKTLWNCTDHQGNPIWAKQLLPPFERVHETEVVDDLGRSCRLNDQMYSLLKLLVSESVPICYLSVGAVYGLPEIYQPSINILKKFTLFQYFEKISSLEYKSYKKSCFFDRYSEFEFVLIDDSEDVLTDILKCKNCFGISSLDLHCAETVKREVFV